MIDLQFSDSRTETTEEQVQRYIWFIHETDFLVIYRVSCFWKMYDLFSKDEYV